MSHITAIGDGRATCTCGWIHEADQLSSLQMAAIGHELDPPAEPAAPRETHGLDPLALAAASLTQAEHEAQEWRDERDRLVVEAIEEGRPVAHIARAAGVSRQTVYEIARRQ